MTFFTETPIKDISPSIGPEAGGTLVSILLYQLELHRRCCADSEQFGLLLRVISPLALSNARRLPYLLVHIRFQLVFFLLRMSSGLDSILLLLSHRAIYLLYSFPNPTSIMLLRCTPLTDVCVGLQPVACFQLMMSVLLAFSCNLLPLLAFRLFQFVNSSLWTLSLRPSQVSHMFSLVRWP